MIEVIKEIIVDNQNNDMATGISRRIEIEHITGKATICIGVRRSGKSTFMHQIIKNLKKSGVKKENVVCINFFDDRLHKLLEKGFNEIVEAYYMLFPEKKGTEKVYFFFDEIQAFEGWEQFVERLMRTELCDVYITGSSARMLSREIATQMRGRGLSWEIFPFSFQEFLDLKKVDSTPPFTSKNRFEIQNAFELYWNCGGFPEVALVSDNVRIKVHQEYFQTILYRDLVDRYDVSHPKLLKDLAHYLIENSGCLYSVNSLYGYLKSLNHSTQRSQIAEYIEWMEDCYFLFTVRLYDASLSRSNSNPKKIYCIDHSFVKSIASGILVNSGHLLENLVFITLRRYNQEIYYYKTETGKEVDFLVCYQRCVKALFQVCESLQNEKTKKREVVALTDAMSEQNLKTAIIVTKKESETIETPAGVITVMPIWQFLLNMNI